MKGSRSTSLLCESIVHYGVRLARICGDIGLNFHVIGFLQISQVSISPSQPKYKQHNDMKGYQGLLLGIQHQQRPNPKQLNSQEMCQIIANSKGALQFEERFIQKGKVFPTVYVPSIPNECRQEPL